MHGTDHLKKKGAEDFHLFMLKGSCVLHLKSIDAQRLAMSLDGSKGNKETVNTYITLLHS